MQRSMIVITVTLMLGLLMTPRSIVAQPPLTSAAIGVLSNATPGAPGFSALIDVFRQELRTRGWAEGQNLTIEYR